LGVSAVTIKRFTIPQSDRVLRAFFHNTAFFSAMMGPVGGGKTVASLQRFIRFARLQTPHPVDRVRRTKWVSIRRTYREHERTTIPTWNAWWPREAGEWRGGANGEPATHRIAFDLPDGTMVDTTVIFAAVGETDIQEFAGGFEITGFHIGEMADHVSELASKMLERCGRYPRVETEFEFSGASWYGGWGDLNAPNYGHWIEQNFVVMPQPGYMFFRQPGGLEPDAENLQNLVGGRDYYLRMAASKPEHEVRRFVHNLFGYDRSGKPVYPSYNPFRHQSRVPLQLLRGRKLFCGLDQGRSPAAAFVQRAEDGQIRILRELPLNNVDAREFGRQLKEFIRDFCPDFDIEFVCDPAALNPTELSEHADDVWIRIVENELDATIRPASSIRRTAREQHLHSAMKLSITGTREMLQVDPSCRLIHEGLTQMFRFKKVSANGQPDRYASEIEKNDHSHPCEAAEYAVMEACGLREVLGYQRPPERITDADMHWRPSGF
jgi:hypothetical protein